MAGTINRLETHLHYIFSLAIELQRIVRSRESHIMEKLFRSEKERAEECVRLAVNERLRLGKYLLLFPYEVNGNKFRTTLKRKFLCWGLAVLMFVSCIITTLTMLHKTPDTFSFLFWGPTIISNLTILINQIWVHSKKAVLDDFLSNIQKCRPHLKVDDKKDTLESYFPIFFMSAVYVGFWVIALKDRPIDVLTFLFLYSQIVIILCIAILEQFILLLTLLRRQLSRTNLLSDLDQDALITAAADLNEVFSPQILITILVIFLSQLGKIYSTIIFKAIIDWHDFVIIFLQSYPIWRVVSSCEEFAKEKRMEFHLSMRKKIVFSASCMFDLDYDLICGMVTSAASYILVLLQFTDRNQSKPKSDVS